MIHFAGYQKPWDVVDCDFAHYFWKYAQISPYYPRLLRKTLRCLGEEELQVQPTLGNNQGIRKMANKLLPYGSRRRETVKKVYRTICK